MIVRSLNAIDLPDIQRLAEEADAEGFRFMTLFLAGFERHAVACDSAEEFFLVVEEGERLVGVGGVTPDPHGAEPATGRLRHLYVSPGARRRGIGETLVRALESRAAERYQRLRLRTDSVAAAQFYERLGYLPRSEAHATHARRLTDGATSAT